MPKLKKKLSKVITTTATVVPEPRVVETMTTMTKMTVVDPEVMTQIVEPVKAVVVLEIPEPVVETFTTRVVEPSSLLLKHPIPLFLMLLVSKRFPRLLRSPNSSS